MQIVRIARMFAVLGSLACATKVEVVLAHYNEDLSWLTKLPEDTQIRVYTKGLQSDIKMPFISRSSLQQLSNVGRESHTYLKHIVENYERLADWTVFTQAGEPSFGYKGHRSGGGHLLAGDDFANYLVPHPSGSRFVYTAVVHLPSMNHLLRAAYCINDELLEEGDASMCPQEASQWTTWWDIGNFRQFISSMIKSQHGEEVMDFYRKYINPAFTGDEITAFFPQGARFAVSKETVHRRPKSDYERLLVSLSNDEDPYAGYFMEWLWSELFLGHLEPCPVPAKLAAVSHSEAMNSLAQRFPTSVQRQLRASRHLTGNGVSGIVGDSGCVCVDISGGTSSGISVGISDGLSGSVSGDISADVSGGISSGLSGGLSGSISGGISGSIFGGISGGVSSSPCVCNGTSDGILGGLSGGVSGGISDGVPDSISGGGISGGSPVDAPTGTATTTSTARAVSSDPGLSSETLSTTAATSTVTKSGTLTSVSASWSTTTAATTRPAINVNNLTNTTIVAGVLEVEVYVQRNISGKEVHEMFTRAIAVAVEIPVELVVSLQANELKISSGSQRRLQDNTTKWYEVAFEIVVPSHMDAERIIQKADRIAQPGSSESQLFRQVLLITDGVVGVGKIVSRVPAYMKTHTSTTATPSKEENGKEWVAALVGAIAIILLISCLVTTSVLYKRKTTSTEAAMSSDHSAIQGDIEDGHRLVPNVQAPAEEPSTPGTEPMQREVEEGQFQVATDQAPVEPSLSKSLGVDAEYDSRPIPEEAHLVPEGIIVNISDCRESCETTAGVAAAPAVCSAARPRAQYFI